MDIILIGAFSEIFELCEECGYNDISYVDKIEYRNCTRYRYLGDDLTFFASGIGLFAQRMAIVPDDPITRNKLVELYGDRGYSQYPVITSPSAKISQTAAIGKGSVIQWGAHVSSYSSIGDFVKINVLANIMHDTIVDNFTTVAPSAAIMGRVRIGRYCYIGANATVLPGVSICDRVVIGAGAVVTKSITESGAYVGVPATRIT